jgi:hypothetical protein
LKALQIKKKEPKDRNCLIKLALLKKWASFKGNAYQNKSIMSLSKQSHFEYKYKENGVKLCLKNIA